MTTRGREAGAAFVLIVSTSVLASGCASNPIASPATAPAASVGPASPLLFSDDFNAYNPRWRQVRGQWSVIDGSLRQTRDEVRELNTVFYYDPLTIADADITVETTMLADLPQFLTKADEELLNVKRRVAGAGIVFRYQDESNFYLFRIAGEEGAVLGKVVNGEWKELANPRAANFVRTRLKMDTPYTLRVRVAGKRIQCWLAGQAVANLDDESFSTGRIGLTTFRSKASFSFVRVAEY
jgi:hypothetical protein